MVDADDLRTKIAELEDDISCAEHDQEQDGGANYDLDSAYCKLADLEEQLKRIAAK